MTDHIRQLTTVISKEADLAVQLEQLLDKKLEAFICWNKTQLEQVTAEEETLIAQFQKLERRRIALLETISAGCLLDGALLTKNDLGALDESGELHRQFDRLHSASTIVKKRNTQNQHLLQHSLAFVQHTLSVLTNNFQHPLLDHKV